MTNLLFWAIIKLLLGVVFLLSGAEFLIHYCILLARCLGVRPIVIGLTIVAFGTSTPELFVTVMANLGGQSDLAIGNIIGSNIANIGLILGFAAFLRPFSVPRRICRVELPFMVLSVVLTGVAVWQGVLSRFLALILLLTFGIYLYFLVNGRSYYGLAAGEPEVTAELNRSVTALVKALVIIVLSFCGLLLGSRWLIAGATDLARYFHYSELIIGLTITAVGTSLPELASTISAIRRREAGLILGNVIGSNFANICAILGVGGLIRPMSIDHHVLLTDFPAMAILSLVLIPIFKKGYISRIEGFMLLMAYFSFVTIIYLKV